MASLTSPDPDSKSLRSSSPVTTTPTNVAPPSPSAWQALWHAPKGHQAAAEPLVWNKGLGEWFRSLGRKGKSVLSVRFLVVLLAGQFVSVCLTATNVQTTQLGIWGWQLPTTQTFFLYLFLNLFWTPVTIWKYGWRGWGEMVRRDGWKYLILAAIDVEGNYTVVKAYQYTDLLSCELLDAFATPVCMIWTFFLVRARFHWTQILGVLVCLGGLGVLVASDHLTDKNYPAENRVLGDILMLIGAACYGTSNGLEEFFIRRRPLYEVVGQMGFWGMIINGIQCGGLEHNDIRNAPWDGRNIGILISYTVSMLCLYTIAPLLFRFASSPFYNLSILTSDFYGLCFGLGLYHYSPYWLYFPAYALVLSGLIIYFSVARPESVESLNNIQGRGKKRPRSPSTSSNDSNPSSDIERDGRRQRRQDQHHDDDNANVKNNEIAESREEAEDVKGDDRV